MSKSGILSATSRVKLFAFSNSCLPQPCTSASVLYSLDCTLSGRGITTSTLSLCCPLPSVS
eukprot:591832-Pleurochrysis_carterae.AAC.1